MSFVFENVSKQFLNQNESTLQRINLEIQTGEFVCIVGKSGCGKSTLLNLAAGLLTPSSGRILLDGKEVNGPGVEMTVMFQEHALYPWLIMMLWDFLVAAALVALFGFVGLQVNTYIMSVAAFVILYSAFNNVMLLSTLRSNEKNLKLEGEELVSLSVKQTLKRLLISCAVIVVLSLAAVFVCGGNVAQTCLALIIAVAVNTLSAIFAAPRLWMSLNK